MDTNWRKLFLKCAVTDDVEQNRDASASCICEKMEEAINRPLRTFMRPRY